MKRLNIKTLNNYLINMKSKIFLFIFLSIISISLILALPNEANNRIDFDYTTSGTSFSSPVITSTGSYFFTPEVFLDTPKGVYLNGTLYTPTGVWLTGYSYNEVTGYPYGLTSLKFNDTVAISGALSITTAPGIQNLSFPELTHVTGAFTASTLANLTNISLPKLVSTGGVFTISGASTNITDITLPELTQAGGISIAGGTNTTINLPKLKTSGGLGISSNSQFSVPNLTTVTGAVTVSTSNTTINISSIKTIGGNLVFTVQNHVTTVDVSSLEFIGGQVTIQLGSGITAILFSSLKNIGLGSTNINLANTMSNLGTLYLPNMVTYNGKNIYFQTGTGNLTNVTLGTIGILKDGGATVNGAGQKLTQASVDGILALYASLDGTNGTTSFGTGKTITINGGTSSTPSAQGLIDKATIQARGATVSTN